MAKAERGIEPRDLFGGRSLTQKAALQPMRELERRLTAEFDERTTQRAKLAAPMAALRAPLIEAIAADTGATKAVADLRKLAEAARTRKPREPHRARAESNVFAGSIGATHIPPYDYQWTWNATNGSPSVNHQAANRTTGDIAVNIDTDTGGNSSSISGRAAVGIYFYPPVANGLLQIWATPAYTEDWFDICTFDSCHADGWIGLYVGSYDLSGAFTGAVVDQQVTLWNDSSWWAGGSGQGSNSGFGLYAPPIDVDQDHQYLIWVWIGADASGDGWHTFSGSAAGDDLNVHVPSITWRVG
jgi:hypothetical protein